jgi:nitrite reductase (NAD(P)H)
MAPVAIEIGYSEYTPRRKKVVVVGFGMVGAAFVEKLLKYDDEATEGRQYGITVIGEEQYLGYNRVGLTQYFKHRSVEALLLNPSGWYAGHDTRLSYHLGDKVRLVETDAHRVITEQGRSFDYDICVLATGSNPSLPPYITPARAQQTQGVFTYRTIDDLDDMIAYAKAHSVKKVHVVGGGLLGLEAAGAARELEGVKEVVVVERNQWLLNRQLDHEGGKIVTQRIRAMGVQVLTSTHIQDILTTQSSTPGTTSTHTEVIQGLLFSDGEQSPCEMVVYSIGITARDELARVSGLDVDENKRGIVVGDDLSTSARDVYAVGECASWKGNTYGLIGPGIEMADVLAFNLTLGPTHSPRAMTNPDMSTRLKLLGVDVASFGDYFADKSPAPSPAHGSTPKGRTGVHGTSTRRSGPTAGSGVHAIRYDDPFASVYKKYLFSADGKYLLGGMMVSDITGYEKLAGMVKKKV